MFRVTTFESKFKNSKKPISPFDDKTFDFRTTEVRELSDIARIMSCEFILNVPLSVNKVRSERKIAQLHDKICQEINYFVLDIDDIKNKDDLTKVLRYFSEYKCIILESRSHNSVDNFNLKGVIECRLNLDQLKIVCQQLHYDLLDICSFDQSVSRRCTINAPIQKYKVLFENVDGKIFEFNSVDITVKPKAQPVHEFKVPDVQTENAQTIEELCLSIFQSMGFVAVSADSDGSITFRHPSEKKSPGGYFWFRSSPFYMHHFNKSRTVNIYPELSKNPLYKELLKKQIKYDELLELHMDFETVLKIQEKFLSVTDDVSSAIDDFLQRRGGLFAIKSPMGTGKSVIINQIIEDSHEMDLRVLIITNRISVAEDFAHKYNLKLYNRDEYKTGDSLICQFDSLWKYNIKNFDVAVLDEFMSLLFHSRTSINRSYINFAKYLASFNLKLVIADAFLTGYEVNFLKFKKDNTVLIENDYRDDAALYEYSDLNYFTQVLLQKSKRNKITISCTSLAMIDALFLLLVKRGLRVVTLTAETPQSTKELIYKIFETDEDRYDVLIYSPTLTVGISNMNNIDCHFHYDSAMTCDVISSLQMIKRSRKAKEIHYFIKNKSTNLRISYDDIRDEYLNNVTSLSDDNYLFDINNYGEPVVSKLGKAAINIDVIKNILSYNQHDAFNFLLKYHFKRPPVLIENRFETNVLLPYQKESKSKREELLKAVFAQYMQLNDIEKAECDISSSQMQYILWIDSQLKVIDSATKEELFRIALDDRRFILKCKYYLLCQMVRNNEINDVMYQNYITKAILSNNNELFEFLTKLRQIRIIEDSYKSGNLTGSVKFLTSKMGYRLIGNGRGMQKFGVPPEVKKFSEFVVCTF